MKIAVMGSGGVGGGFGARLAAAGNDVTFIARGKHLAAMKEHGLDVQSPMLGDVLIKPAKCTDDPGSVGPVDLVLFCVKLWDTESAAQAIKPMVSDSTAVMSLQNGISKDDILKQAVGETHVIGGISYIASTIKAPGVIDQRGAVQKIVFGEFDRTDSARGSELHEVFKAAGIESVLSENIERDLWKKFVYLVAMSSVLAATRQTIGPVRSNPQTRRLLVDVMQETQAVGEARGIEFEPYMIQRHMGYFDGLAPDVTASMQHDLSIGNRIELPWLAGTVVELGKKLKVSTPVTSVLFDVLSPYIEGAR